MKQTLLRRVIAWWFATMAPMYAPLTTIERRETMRKRQLFSVILLIGFFGPFFAALIGLLTKTDRSQVIQNLVGTGSALVALWINRRGYLKVASLWCLISGFFGLAGMVVTASLNTPVFSFVLWPLLLLLPVMAGLLLPAWGALMMGLLEDVFLGWFILYGGQSQIALSLKAPGDRTMFLVFSCIITSIITIFSAISSYVTKKAVIQADRAVEVEQANQALSEAYSSLEAIHTLLETTHLELEGAHITIQKQALTDALTGLPNHRAVMEQFTKEIERARRHRLAFSLLFFDADHFKRVNDTYGHAAGDAVLREIGECAASCLRLGDTLGRFGGEEFVILLFEADSSGASVVAERLRAAVAAAPVALSEVEGGISMTVSIGQATYREDGESEQELLVQADQAMYVSKRMGRNQVRNAAEARKMSADPLRMASWDEQTRIETMQREGVSPEQIQQTIQATNNLEVAGVMAR